MKSLLIAACVAIAPLATADAHWFGLGTLPEEPQSYSCEALAAQIGAGSVWFGRYAGTYNNTLTDRHNPYSRQGCFPSEFECRVWQHQNISYTNGGKTIATSCRPGLG